MNITITLYGQPITKKNSQRIVQAAGRIRIIPSKNYLEYLDACRWQLNVLRLGEMKISSPINLKCVYYMPTRHRVDLVNLLEDIDKNLPKAPPLPEGETDPEI